MFLWSNMIYLLIRCSEEWLEWSMPDSMIGCFSACGNLHMDETRIQCNKEDVNNASGDSWMWVVQGVTSEPIKVVGINLSSPVIPFANIFQRGTMGLLIPGDSYT